MSMIKETEARNRLSLKKSVLALSCGPTRYALGLLFCFESIIITRSKLIFSNSVLVKSTLQVKLGTVEQNEAENEWVITPYTNTAKKHQFIGE